MTGCRRGISRVWRTEREAGSEREDKAKGIGIDFGTAAPQENPAKPDSIFFVQNAENGKTKIKN